MEATLKKGVGLLLLVFIGYYLVTDPNGAAGAAKDVFGRSGTACRTCSRR